MPGTNYMVELPSELLAQVFEEMADRDLYSVMLVCTRWREIAMDCRSHWQHIMLWSAAPGPVTRFQRLLQRSKGRPLFVFMNLTVHGPLVTSVVFPALADHIHQVVSIHMRLPIAACSDLLQNLRLPAPLLRVFHLDNMTYPSQEDILPEVPVDIFANRPGSLNTVRLYNVLLPETTAPPAFGNVVFVRFDQTGRSVVPAPDVFLHFPKIKYLSFFGCIFPASESYFRAMSIDQLKWLYLFLDYYPDGLTWRMPLYTVAHVTIVVSDPPWNLTGLLSQVYGPLQLAFRGHPYDDYFTMTVGDLEWQRSRTLIVHWNHWFERRMSAQGEHIPEAVARFEREFFFLSYSIGNRIQSLAVPHDLLDCVIDAFPTFPNVTELRVVSRGCREYPFPEFLEGDYQMTLPYPRLQRLILHSSPGSSTLSAATLTMFATRVFPPAALPLPVLSLEKVVLEMDDKIVLAPYFTSIERGFDWQYPFGLANPMFETPHSFEEYWL